MILKLFTFCMAVIMFSSPFLGFEGTMILFYLIAVLAFKILVFVAVLTPFVIGWKHREWTR